jgi:hypothetical protein
MQSQGKDWKGSLLILNYAILPASGLRDKMKLPNKGTNKIMVNIMTIIHTNKLIRGSSVPS